MKVKQEKDWLEVLDQKLLEWFWKPDQRFSGIKAWGFFILKMFYMAARNAYKDRLPFSANALTFMTLLGLVPALAISFSLAKGMGFSQRLREMLLTNELLVNQREIFEQILSYVDRTQVGTLGVMGLLLLIVTLLITIASMEDVFNRIWEVRVQRTWLRRFTDYLSVMVICPLLVMAATGSWAAFSSHAFVRWIFDLAVVGEMARSGMNLGPYFMLAAAFTIVYIFLPNRKVTLSSGAIAGLVTALLYWVVQSVYIFFQVGVSKYNAIYGGFAVLPLFMVWLQVSWTVVLFGAELAHAHRVCLEGPAPRNVYPPFKPAQREGLALGVMNRLACSFHRGEPPVSLSQLAIELKAPLGEMHKVALCLLKEGLIVETEDGAVQPGRDLSTINLADVVIAVRGLRVAENGPPSDSCGGDLGGLLDQAAMTAAKSLKNHTLLDLVKREEPEKA